MEVCSATFLLPVIEQILLDDVEGLKRLWERGPDVIAPVCGAVADHSAAKVNAW